jgi:hypothetical protein
MEGFDEVVGRVRADERIRLILEKNSEIVFR